MASRTYTSRSEFERYRFSPLITVAVPFVLIVLQAFLPRLVPGLIILNLPLIAVIYFAVALRNPIFGALTGAAIGLLQDALTGQPIGINGMAKTLIGYAAASIGLQVDVENLATRALLSFGFTLIQSTLLFLIRHYLLGIADVRLVALHEVVRALLNTAIALPLFHLLDRAKKHD